MRHLIVPALALAALAALVAPASPSIAAAQPSVAQIAVSDAAVRAAAARLDALSAHLVREAGARYTTPRVVGYQESALTGCGRIGAGNAYACRADGTIYYDRAFLAALMARAASGLGTDGDMAAVAPLAHEWGHALQYLLALDYTTAPNRNETDADCVAGVLLVGTRGGSPLPPADLAEAEYTMSYIGDAPMATGDWGRAIEQINAASVSSHVPPVRNTWGTHGNARERLAAFHHGLASSLGECFAGIRRLGPATAPVITTTQTIHWYVDDTATAYDRAVSEHRPLVFVLGTASATYFVRLKNETLLSPVLAQLAPVAVFAYADPAHDIVARHIGEALGYGETPVISLLAPNGSAIDEQSRIVGFWDAPTLVTQLSKGMRTRGWLPPLSTPPAPRAPWLPPRGVP